MKLVSFFFFIFILLNSCTHKSSEEQVIEWISNHAIPLNSVLAGTDNTDLQLLKDIVGDARIVSLGEPTHGNREVFQLKHRMIEYLVTEKGFNIFALECPFGEAYDINRYVVEGIGEPEKALAGIYYWSWDTQEVLDLLKCLRAYNANPSHKNKVKFYGFDPQDPERAARAMLEYIAKVDPDLEKKVRPELGVLEVPFSNPELEGRRHFIPEESDSLSLIEIQRVLKEFVEKKEHYVKASSLSEWILAKQHAQQIEYYIKSNINDGLNYNKERDLGAAENVKWILDHEGDEAKAILWAHNSHVGNSPRKGYEMMGYHLRQWYGEQSKIFGFFFNKGSFRALDEGFPSNGMSDFTVEPAPKETFEHKMVSAGLSLAMLDMQQLPESGTVHDWFNVPQPTQYSWGGFKEGETQLPLWSYNLKNEFDVLVFIDSTTIVKPINNADFEFDASLDKKLDHPTNLDFEDNYSGEAPTDWVVWSKFKRVGAEFVVTDVKPYQGKNSAMVQRPDDLPYGEIGPNLKQFIDAKPYRGKTIRFSAAARAEVSPSSFVFLRLAIEPSIHENVHRQNSAFFDSLDNYRVTSSEWHIYEIEAKVSETAHVISYGIYLRDFGTAWLDAVQIEIVE